jgi:hypothetical protein
VTNDLVKSTTKRICFALYLVLFSLSIDIVCIPTVFAIPQAQETRVVSGVIVNNKREALPNVTVVARTLHDEQSVAANGEGRFRFVMRTGPVTLHIEGKYLRPLDREFTATEATENIEIAVAFVVPPVHEKMVIVADAIEPAIDRRNDAIYKSTLFGRDDQLLFTLDAGINAGQPRRWRQVTGDSAVRI